MKREDRANLVATYIVAIDLAEIAITGSESSRIPTFIRQRVMEVLGSDTKKATNLATEWTATGFVCGEPIALFVAANVGILFYRQGSLAHEIFLQFVHTMSDEEIEDARAFAYELAMPYGQKN